MSVLKRIIPLPLKSFYHKIKWFSNHYGQIGYNAELRADHYHGKITYDTDGLTTSANCDFIYEPRFASAYSAAVATNPWEGFTLQWRVYIVCWFADFVKNLPGDFVECGVNTGAYARAIIEYTNFNSLDKTFYLFDTFEGFPVSQVTAHEKQQGIDHYGGTHYKDVYEEVKQTFAQFRVKLIKGLVPGTLEQCDATQIAYLSIDMNAVAPEIAAINFFWDRLVKGAVVMLDDYGFSKHIHQKKAFDEFARKKQIEILALHTGQGIFFKP